METSLKFPLPVPRELARHLECCDQQCLRSDRKATSAPTSESLPEQSGVRLALLGTVKQEVGIGKAAEEKILEALCFPGAREEMERRIARLLSFLDIAEMEAESMAREMVQEIAAQPTYSAMVATGMKWGQYLEDHSHTAKLDEYFMERNKAVAELIAPRLSPGTLLDHDSGNSYVANFIAEARPDVRVHTTDSLDVREEICHLPFDLYDYAQKELPFADGSFDQALLATVLHHCDEPEKMFDEVLRTVRPGGKIYLFENSFAQGDRRERMLNILFDWFFNTVAHKSDLPCPFAHFCVEEWKFFLEQKGLEILEFVNIGQYTAIPLDHILYVARKPH